MGRGDFCLLFAYVISKGAFNVNYFNIQSHIMFCNNIKWGGHYLDHMCSLWDFHSCLLDGQIASYLASGDTIRKAFIKQFDL